jgi:hypothetical protein
MIVANRRGTRSDRGDGRERMNATHRIRSGRNRFGDDAKRPEDRHDQCPGRSENIEKGVDQRIGTPFDVSDARQRTVEKNDVPLFQSERSKFIRNGFSVDAVLFHGIPS